MEAYDGPGLYRSSGAVLRGRRIVCRPLRENVRGPAMENIIVGVVALLLFIYLLVAMIRPEKF